MSLLDELIFASDQLVEFHAAFRARPSATHTVSLLEAYQAELKNLWLDVKQAYSKCVRSDDEDFKESLSVIKAKYQNSSSTYFSCTSEISDSLQLLQPKEKQPIVTSLDPCQNNDNSLPNDQNSHNIKVPACDTQDFHGNYLDWPSFRDMFTAVFIKHSKLSGVQKLFHLRAKTKDQAFNIVNKFALTDDNFILAWNALTEQYENKRILVNNQIQILLNQQRISVESGKSLKMLQSNFNDALIALKSYNIETQSWDAIITYLCASRLPDITLSWWEQSLDNPADIPTWEKMNLFLTNRYRVLESVSEMKQNVSIEKVVSKTMQSQNVKAKPVRNFHLKINPSCQVCSEQHPLRLCPTFLKLSVDDRHRIVRKHKFCFNCLALTHQVNQCQSTSTCFRCRRKHHTLLHFETKQTPSLPSSVSLPSSSHHQPSSSQISSSNQIENKNIQSTPTINHNVMFSKTNRQVLLATALVKIRHQGTEFEVRALIDQGSEVSFISEDFQKRLGLSTKSVQARICGMGSTFTASSSKLCTFILGSNIDKDFSIQVQALVLKKLTGNLPSLSLDFDQSAHQFEFTLADPLFYQSSGIDVLIGADLYPSIILEGLKPNVLSTIMAQNTVFGWVLLGPFENTPVVSAFSTFVTYSQELSMDQTLEKFWKLEELPPTSTFSPSEQYCEDLFQRSTFRDPTGRYVVKLPFKQSSNENTIQLGHSRYNAMKQFLRNEKSLIAKPLLKTKYDEVLSEYLTLGHMSPTSSCEVVNGKNILSYYLPHHAVLKPQSTTTKLRVVFNASSLSSNGKSLNDLLHPGPVLQTDITFLILNWRFYKYVFNGDIEKMYRQILVHPDHLAFQRILFRSDPDQKINDHQLNTVTFGVNCAPFLAIRTLHQLGKDVKVSYPLASKILMKEFYVDDALSGAHDLVSALEAQNELILALQSAGFHLRKWTANSPKLLNHLPSDHLLNKDFLKLECDSSTKTLGIRWNASSDTFSFAINPESFSTVPITKRSVLSTIARLYDPSGWLAPIVISAKILMQDIWKDKTGWDENLLPRSEQNWKSFLENFVEIPTISIPRWVEFAPWTTLQLHGFCDASEKAYAAAVYVRVSHKSIKTSSHLLWAKTKVAPVNSISLPRLELQGAFLLSRMIRMLLDQFHMFNGITLRLWTDSTIVLAWLSKPPSTWKTYVANRVSEISSNVRDIPWNHVSSSDNPADLATRGVSPQELKSNRLWWAGPDWLINSEECWPSSDASYPPDESILEFKQFKVNVTILSNEFEAEILRRFSSWHKAVRVLCYVLRFCNSTRKQGREKYQSKTLRHDEIHLAKEKMIRLIQKQYFQHDYEALMQGKKLRSKSHLLTLTPYLDSNKIMRSHGRLASSTLSYNERFPILLPYDSYLSELLILYVHQLSLHGEIHLMIRIVRSEYWIPKLKNLIKKCIKNCKPCILYKKSVRTQIMGSLPVERTTLSLPFTNIGIDFAGPFIIRNYYGRRCRLEKGYACLFICFATKAIHLEAVSELSTQAFLASFNRFVSRRGLPAKIYTDNGTNFVGASKHLISDFQKALMSYPNASASNFSQIIWKFIPPGSPHMGGLWEAGVKSFKIHFKKIAGNSKFTFEEFTTLLARIESCLNSRPISRISENPEDIVPLTPGHFLRGGPLLSPPEPSESHKDIRLLQRWNSLKIIHHQFSIRWKEEYLKELIKRYKWKYPQRDISIDDIVVLRNEQLPPNEWRLGRVVKVCRGPDNRVRVVDVQTQNGVVTRSIAKLCVLLSD